MRPEQAAFWRGLLSTSPFAPKVAAVTYSGGKSLHGLLHVGCRTLAEWQAVRDKLRGLLAADPDPAFRPTNRRCDRERVRACLAFADSQTARRNASCISIPKPCALRRRSPTRADRPRRAARNALQAHGRANGQPCPRSGRTRREASTRRLRALCAGRDDADIAGGLTTQPRRHSGRTVPPSRRLPPLARGTVGGMGTLCRSGMPHRLNILVCPLVCPLLGLKNDVKRCNFRGHTARSANTRKPLILLGEIGV